MSVGVTCAFRNASTLWYWASAPQLMFFGAFWTGLYSGLVSLSSPTSPAAGLVQPTPSGPLLVMIWPSSVKM